MRFHHLAIGPVLAGCAFVALTSCSTDEKESEHGLGPVTPATTAVSAYDIVKVGNPAIPLDGNLGDWSTVPSIPTFADDPANGRGSLNNSASVKLAWDDTYLYAAYTIN